MADAIEERATYNVVYDNFTKTDAKLEEMKLLLNGFQLEVHSGSNGGRESLTVIKDTVQHLMKETTSTIQRITKELHTKVSTDELQALAQLIGANINKMTENLPKVTSDQKADIRKLLELKEEVVVLLNNDTSINNGDSMASLYSPNSPSNRRGTSNILTIQGYDHHGSKSPAGSSRKMTLLKSPTGSITGSTSNSNSSLWNPNISTAASSTNNVSNVVNVNNKVGGAQVLAISSNNAAVATKVVFPGKGGVRSPSIMATDSNTFDARKNSVFDTNMMKSPTANKKNI